MRNKKRSEKRIKAGIQPSKGNGVKVEAIEMKDPSAVLRQQFQEAKNKKVHAKLLYFFTYELISAIS